jgi:hypothetical protein
MAKPYVMSPFEQFTGSKIDSGLHLKGNFGAYAQATVATTDNTMNPRTASVIVLGPTLNKTGSYKVLELSNWNVVTRHKLKILPTPNIIIDFMNKRSEQDFIRKRMTRDPVIGDADVVANKESDEVIESEREAKRIGGKPFDGREFYRSDLEHRSELERNSADGAASQQTSDPKNLTILTEKSDIDENDAYDDYWNEDMLDQNHSIHSKETHKYNLRSGNKHINLVMSVKKALTEHGEKAEEAVKKELLQMINMKVWHPINVKELSEKDRRSIIRSSMFLKEKFDLMQKF